MARRGNRAIPPSWRLEAPRVEDGGRRVSVVFAGRPFAFWSESTALEPAVEAFAGPLLLPAMKAGAVVRIEAPVDATWVLGTRTLTGVFAEWWGYPARYPFQLDSVVRDETHPAPGHGLCFTGGVDSFFSLLTASSRYDHLVYVHGLDVPIDDAVRRKAVTASLEAVAAETGKRIAFVYTDLREHPVLASVSWERAHGAVLAAAGHLLGSRIGQLSIPPSWNVRRRRPWGSHPQTDELWSTHRVRIHHGDATVRRLERIRQIAHYPVVWRHLRVCWENLAPTGNCSRCEKCLRTMTNLAALGVLERFEAFDASPSLAARIDGLGPVAPSSIRLWATLLERGLPDAVAAAVRRLIARSRPPWWRRLLPRRPTDRERGP